MKNLVKSFAAMLAVGAFVSACNTDPCKDVDCGTQGTCTEGLCVCNSGYEKDSTGKCNIEWAAKFAATYSVQDTCHGTSAGSFAYTSTVAKVSATAITLGNLSGYNNPIDATVTSSFDITVSDTDPAGRVFAGTGSISGSVLTVDYTVTYTDGTKDTCMATMTK